MFLKREGKRFLHGDLICTYTLPEYISDIYVDDLCVISVKLNFETGRDFVSHLLIYFTVTRDDVTGWNDK